MTKRLALVGMVLLVLLVAARGYHLYAEDDLEYLVYFPLVAKPKSTATPTPTWAPPTSTPTATATSTPTPTATPAPQWMYFLTGYDDRKMRARDVGGGERRGSLIDYWGEIHYPKGVFVIVLLDVVNCEPMSGYVSGVGTLWLSHDGNTFFDMAELEVQWAAQDEYNRIGVYDTLQPQFIYKMVFAFDVPPEVLYGLWYRGWGSSTSGRVESLTDIE